MQFYYNQNNEFLFTIDKAKINYDTQFYHTYKKFMQNLGMKHNTHDGRKTLHSEFARIKAINPKLNPLCIDRIFGHKADNFGDEVYSKSTLEELQETIDMIDFRSKKDKKITYYKAI